MGALSLEKRKILKLLINKYQNQEQKSKSKKDLTKKIYQQEAEKKESISSTNQEYKESILLENIKPLNSHIKWSKSLHEEITKYENQDLNITTNQFINKY